MDKKIKKRAENWSPKEKKLLRELISQALLIVENKNTKTSSNIRKAQEWKNITKKLNALTGKNRSDGEVKLAWKRMKVAAKANSLAHRQEQMQTGDGEKPNSPSSSPLQFPGTSNENAEDTTATPRNEKNMQKKDPRPIKELMQEQLLKSNTHFKTRQLEMLHVEHEYNIEIAKLKIKKLRLQIEILENTKSATT